ncbi:hypothetical protein N9B43_02525 [Mariniblastus sp.]|nr:hypothetical protein [Mariniblastus sp.]
MSIWTKPLALAFVSACLTVASVGPHSAFAQSPNTAVLLTGATEPLNSGEMGTTAKLINIEPVDNPQVTPTQPRRVVNQLANFNETKPVLPTVVKQQTPDTFVALPLLPPPSNSIVTTKTPPLPISSKTALPTVIVRPPAEGFFEGDGVSVDVDRVDPNSPNEFSLKLRVPHSVKIIEVTPIQNGSVAQNYKIKLTQKPDGRHITSEVTHLLEKTPGELVANQISAVEPQPILKPIEIRPGFQPNPFFNTELPAPTERVAKLPQTVSQRQPNLSQTSSVKSTIMPLAESKPGTSQEVSPAASVLTSENAAHLNAGTSELNFTEYAAPTLAEPAPVTMTRMNTVPPIVSSSQANSAEQAVYKATSGQTTSHEMLEGVAFNSADSAMPRLVPIEIELVGPDTMGLNDVCEFRLELHNPGSLTEENLSIQITLPSGLEFLADDDASLNSTRTRSWNLPRLAAEEAHTIQYLVKSTSEGSKTQKLWISSKGNAPQARQLDTVVDLKFETEDAPMLPFESENE